MEKAYCLLAKQMLIATGNFHGGGSPEGAVAQTWTFDSPLWAFFGYFLSQQKVTESLPQKRLKPRKKSSLLLKSRKTHPQFHPIFRQQPTKKPLSRLHLPRKCPIMKRTRETRLFSLRSGKWQRSCFHFEEKIRFRQSDHAHWAAHAPGRAADFGFAADGLAGVL